WVPSSRPEARVAPGGVDSRIGPVQLAKPALPLGALVALATVTIADGAKTREGLVQRQPRTAPHHIVLSQAFERPDQPDPAPQRLVHDRFEGGEEASGAVREGVRPQAPERQTRHPVEMAPHRRLCGE